MFRLLFELILMIAGLVIVVVGGFCAASFCVDVWTEWDMDTAAEKVRNFVKNLWTKYKEKKASSDPRFERNLRYESENIIKILLGEQRYQEHCVIAESGIDPPLIHTEAGDEYSLSYIENAV